MSDRQPLVVNGWTLLAHDLFLDQVTTLIDEVERARLMRRGDRLWLLGYLLLFLVPCLILFLIKMFTVAWAWLALWLVFLLYILRAFPRLHR